MSLLCHTFNKNMFFQKYQVLNNISVLPYTFNIYIYLMIGNMKLEVVYI